jgi:hypothetical protein
MWSRVGAAIGFPQYAQGLPMAATGSAQNLVSDGSKHHGAPGLKCPVHSPWSPFSARANRIVCRALEDELTRSPPKDGEMDFRDNYLMMFSELRIGAAYAICFALKDAEIAIGRAQLVSLAEDLRLIRVQIEKHQIPSDWKLKEPLPFSTAEPGEAPERVTLYDKADPVRAHIGRIGVSDRGSIVWEVVELPTHSMRWIERHTLADAMLDVFSK